MKQNPASKNVTDSFFPTIHAKNFVADLQSYLFTRPSPKWDLIKFRFQERQAHYEKIN